MSPASHGAQARLWLIFLEKEDMTRDLKAGAPWEQRRKGVVEDWARGRGEAPVWLWGEGRRCAALSWIGGQGEGGAPLRGPRGLQ